MKKYNCLCGKLYTKKALQNHFNYCVTTKNLNKKNKFLSYWNIICNDKINIDNIKMRYYDNKESILDIGKSLGLNYSIYKLFSLFNIEKISHSEAIKKVQYKNRKTCLKKYGVENPSQVTEIKEKKRLKSLEKYGVENVFQAPEIIKKIKNTVGSHEKRKAKMLERYGYTSPFQDPEIHKRALLNSAKTVTKLNKRAYSILENNNIKFKAEFWLHLKTENKRFSYDILLINHNIIIELDGDYWHCNPIKYSCDFYHKQKKMTSEEIWKYDELKTKTALNKGFEIYRLWETDFNNMTNKDFYEFIKNKINQKN